MRENEVKPHIMRNNEVKPQVMRENEVKRTYCARMKLTKL